MHQLPNVRVCFCTTDDSTKKTVRDVNPTPHADMYFVRIYWGCHSCTLYLTTRKKRSPFVAEEKRTQRRKTTKNSRKKWSEKEKETQLGIWSGGLQPQVAVILAEQERKLSEDCDLTFYTHIFICLVFHTATEGRGALLMMRGVGRWSTWTHGHLSASWCSRPFFRFFSDFWRAPSEINGREIWTWPKNDLKNPKLSCSSLFPHLTHWNCSRQPTFWRQLPGAELVNDNDFF